tara:strand:- start:48 stop:1436 length:1389 start_codon:yes stop_codon:yes gene_type:complete
MILNEHNGQQTEKTIDQQVNFDTGMKQKTKKLSINLLLEDPEIINTLLVYPEGQERDEFIFTALKFGIHAMKYAGNNVLGENIKHESEKMLSKLKDSRNEIRDEFDNYFNPEKGRFAEILQRFVKDGGEIQKACNDVFNKEFSLDNNSGALKKVENTISNANLEFKNFMQEAVQNFSLDKKDSAINRLLEKVTEETKKIIEAEAQRDNAIQSSVMTQLQQMNTNIQTMDARRKESYTSTRHGDDFQSIAYEYIVNLCEQMGDIAEDTGSRTGKINNRRVGDCVITLGPEAEQSGARIVVEMKQDKSYTLAKSLNEIEFARKNRDASVGLFIFSKYSASEQIPQFSRYGNDIIVIWDAEDPATDTYLRAALSLCKGLAIRSGNSSEKCNTDMVAIEKSTQEIENQIKNLDKIEKSSNSIKKNADNISNSANLIRSLIEKEIGILNSQFKPLREMIGSKGIVFK